MTAQGYEIAWNAYQEAVEKLYERPMTAMAERGGGDIAWVEDLDERARALIDRSQELGQAAAQGLAAEDPNQRELAELQLLAASASDLAIADDLVRLDEEAVPREVVERDPLLPAAMTELRSVLTTPPEAGIQSLMEEELGAERSVGPADLQAAKQNLRGAAEGAVTDIRDDVASAGQTAFKGLIAGALLAPVQQAANVALNQLMVMVSEAASFLLRRAAGLVVQAIDKMLKALGKEAQNAARKQAARWIQDLQKDSVFANLLDRLYDTGRIQDAVNQEIDNAPETLGPDPFNTASMRVTQLATKFRKQKQVVTLLLRGLAFARAWLLPITPLGPLALATGYVSALGYVVYAGGDYVDWFRTNASERLDFVPGVRSVICQTLSAGTEDDFAVRIQ